MQSERILVIPYDQWLDFDIEFEQIEFVIIFAGTLSYICNDQKSELCL